MANQDDDFNNALIELQRAAWLNGAMAFKTRAMQLLISMGERELASRVGHMDIPTKENWSDLQGDQPPADEATTTRN